MGIFPQNVAVFKGVFECALDFLESHPVLRASHQTCGFVTLSEGMEWAGLFSVVLEPCFVSDFFRNALVRSALSPLRVELEASKTTKSSSRAVRGPGGLR